MRGGGGFSATHFCFREACLSPRASLPTLPLLEVWFQPGQGHASGLLTNHSVGNTSLLYQPYRL